MKKSLLDVVFASEKRKKVLLLLQNGPREIDFLLNSLDETRTALLPQLKILTDNFLVDHQKDYYDLTSIGKMVVDEMVPLLDTVEFFDSDIDYLGTHNLDFIPAYLLSRITELGEPTVLDTLPVDQYDIQSIYHEKTTETEFVYAVGTFLYPNYYTAFSDLISNNITINLIVSKGLLDKIRTHYRADFTDYLPSDLVNIYVYKKEMDFLYFTFDEYYLLMRLLKFNGDIDNKSVYFSTSSKALEWAKELFEYYLQDAVPVTEI